MAQLSVGHVPLGSSTPLELLPGAQHHSQRLHVALGQVLPPRNWPDLITHGAHACRTRPGTKCGPCEQPDAAPAIPRTASAAYLDPATSSWHTLASHLPVSHHVPALGPAGTYPHLPALALPWRSPAGRQGSQAGILPEMIHCLLGPQLVPSGDHKPHTVWRGQGPQPGCMDQVFQHAYV